MRISILGFGRMGRALAEVFARGGHGVVAGTRHPKRAASVGGVSVRSFEEAATSGEVLVLALPWPGALEVVRQAAPAIESRDATIIDCTNPEAGIGPGLLVGTDTSGAELIADILGRHRVVKALNHVYAELLIEAASLPIRPTGFFCGDDESRKELVATLLEGLGLDPVDVGPLESARYLEPLAQMMVQLVQQKGFGPAEVALQLWRRPAP